MAEIEFLDMDMAIGITQDGQEIKATPYFEDLLFKYANRMGGESGDTIQNIVNNTATNTSIQSAERQVFNTIPASADYTAVNLNMVDAQQGARITLDPNAEDGAQIITTNSDGTLINVHGGGIEVRYKGQTDTDLNMRNKGTSLHWYLFISESEHYWRAS